MTDTTFPSRQYGEDVTVIQLSDKTILLIGTAHISQQSADLVEEIIAREHPDRACGASFPPVQDFLNSQKKCDWHFPEFC